MAKTWLAQSTFKDWSVLLSSQFLTLRTTNLFFHLILSHEDVTYTESDNAWLLGIEFFRGTIPLEGHSTSHWCVLLLMRNIPSPRFLTQS